MSRHGSRIGGFVLALALAGCTATGPDLAARHPPVPTDLPPMKTFASHRVTPPWRSNATIARDFLDLAFRMESGRPLPYMTRFEEPITLRVAGPVPPAAEPDLAALLARLRREAGIDIRRVAADAGAKVTIEFLPRAKLQRLVPQAACFVVPRISSWNEYRRGRRSDEVDWTTLARRERVAIFIPGDVSPQEVRDCLHEELAQAIGPLNDLYRLPDSVFNDDNFHTVLTGFDMLILRAYYAPELGNGTTRQEAERVLPGLLARLNPRGGRIGVSGPLPPTPRAWIDAIETALGPRTSSSRRVTAARTAIEIARNQGWRDTRLAFSLFAFGRLSLNRNASEASLAAFLEAGKIYAANPVTRVQSAHVAMHIAAFALSGDRPQRAIALIDGHLADARSGENAALLASMLLMKAEALDMLGRDAEAGATRRDALGWARYGLGSEDEIRARIAEIAWLNPARSD
ncbi:ATP-dependent transcriptional regulator [Rhodovulum sulfidophilum]|uniref:DUF2927 domain-containing protein n=1 Tax=Rhodovulum sulfidophilum TaxID=35806 RepID=UPI0005A70735|nr:ATP-dependent transcriptional regulator [Rhodovulum sulfidophilum DSM 1374]ANB37855.1 ATP-dependent transcriptional regulator [Rhodovulum sulfidophilum]